MNQTDLSSLAKRSGDEGSAVAVALAFLSVIPNGNLLSGVLGYAWASAQASRQTKSTRALAPEASFVPAFPARHPNRIVTLSEAQRTRRTCGCCCRCPWLSFILPTGNLLIGIPVLNVRRENPFRFERGFNLATAGDIVIW